MRVRGSHQQRPQTSFGRWCSAGAGAPSAHSAAKGKFNQGNRGWTSDLSLFFLSFFFSEAGKNQTTLFVSHSWPREPGCALRGGQAGTSRRRGDDAGGRPRLSPPWGPRPPPLTGSAEPRGRPAESSVTWKQPWLGAGDWPVPTLGPYPAHHSSGKPRWPLSQPRDRSSAGVPISEMPGSSWRRHGCHWPLSRPRRPLDPSEGWEAGARPSSATGRACSAPLLPHQGGRPHGGAARRAARPCRGFPKKGLNSSVEFATSLTTPFPVRGCVRPLFFSLSLFFSLPSPCPQTQRSWRCPAPPEPAGVPLAGTRHRAMARLQVRARRRRLPLCPPGPHTNHGTGSGGHAGGSAQALLGWVLVCAPPLQRWGWPEGDATLLRTSRCSGDSGMHGGVSSPWLGFAVTLGSPAWAPCWHGSRCSWHRAILATALPRVSQARGASAWDRAEPAPWQGAARWKGSFPFESHFGERSCCSVAWGGPLSIWGEDGAVPGSVGTSRVRELARPGDTQRTGTPSAAATGQRAVMAKAHGGLGELTGFGRGWLLGRLFSLLGKHPFFVILPLFAASRACPCLPSGARKLHHPPGLPYPAAPQRCPAPGQPETAPRHAASAGRAGVGCYGGVKGLGDRPCKSRARRHCLSLATGPTPPFSSPSPLA